MLSPRLTRLACVFAIALGAVYAGEVQLPTREAPPPPTATAPNPALSADDAAQKHARRTACLKDARARRLVGAQRATFVKNCVGAAGEH